MKNVKANRTETIGFRTTPKIADKLNEMAEKGHRTLSQQVEMMLLEHPDFKDIRDKVLGKDR